MGIVAPNVLLSDTGILLANAYIAMAKNEVRLFPQANAIIFVNTSYAIWNSYPDRVQGRRPIETRVLKYDYSGNSGNVEPSSVYAAAYTRIKDIFPSSVDQL